MTRQEMRGPFKPSFGLSGVVADPPLSSVSLGAKPRDLQFISQAANEADERASLIEAQLNSIADSEATHREWRRIVVTERVSGVQVHDARLVAAMHIHQIGNLLTLNLQDFRRYKNIVAISPQGVLQQSLGK